MSHIFYKSGNSKDANMTDRYFSIAEDLMELSNLCADEEAVNILKNGSLKIFKLAESHGGIIKTADLEQKPDAK